MARYCENCGKQISDNAVFCKYCGHKQSGDGAEITDRPESIQTHASPEYWEEPVTGRSAGLSKGMIAVIAGAVIAALAVVIVGAVLFFGGSDGSTKKVSKDSIPEGAVEFEGNYYLIYNDPIKWKDAEAKCEETGGHLATITSQEEQDFIVSLIESQGQKYNYWIGANDAEFEGDWQWITGEQWSYTNWREKQPDNKNTDDEDGDQNYLQICCVSKDDPGRYGKWYDMSNSGLSQGYEGEPYFKTTDNTGCICEWDNVED